MRISKVQLAGLAVAVFGVASNASAEDVTISTATTSPLLTSDPVAAGPVASGNITVASGGSITVTAGQSAVTLDSNNTVNNTSGSLLSNDADNTIGIRVVGGNTGSATNAGVISLLESYTMTDTDSDGDLDGAWATGTNRHGIFLQAGAQFNGDITNSGTMTVEGNNSSGITLNALLNGNLTHSGTITLTGDNGSAIAINGGVTGDVLVRGNGTIRGQNTGAVLVNGDIGGDLVINGSWSVSGYHSIGRPSSVTNLDADDLQQGGSAVAIHASVGGGVTIEGMGVEDDVDDDGDGITESAGDTNDDLSATILTYGSAPTIAIETDGVNNIVIGTTSSGYGLHVQGTLAASGVYDNVDATAIRIAGSGASTVSIADGITLDRLVSAGASNGSAYGVVIGPNASTSVLLQRGVLAANVTSDNAEEAVSVLINAGGNMPTLTNSGTIRSQLFGEIGAATGIRDQSGTLTTINNTGAIIALLIPTDADPADSIPAPPATGPAVAIDVSANTTGVTINQTADVVFNDEDTVDDDVNARPTIQIYGDILLGSGADTINLLKGDIIGDVSFGAGADSLTINNAARFAGGITDSDGALTINVVNGTLAHTGGTTNFTTGTFNADAVLGVVLSTTPGASTFLHSSGTITFDPGAEIVPVVPVGLPLSGSQIFLTADGGLIGASNVTGSVTSDGVPYLYNLAINTALGDPNSLEASYQLKTAAQLGLNRNQSIAYDPIIEALRQDSSAAAAMASVAGADAFFDAYTDLMPSYASASTELATTAIQQMQSATTNRMAHTRLQGFNEVSVWAQEIAYGVDRTPVDVNAQAFEGHGFGLAGGIDGPLDNGALFGLSASFITSEAEEANRPEGEISSWFAQGNGYLGTAMGPIDLDFVAGAGFGRMQERRFVEIGSTFAARTEAQWWAYEGHGAARASLPLSVGSWFVMTPQAALTYVALGEQGYEEDGGGDAIDLEADSAFSQRLWADVGVEFSARWELRGGGVIEPRLYAGYRANAIDEEAERTFRYRSTGDEFTLTDDPLGSGGPLVGIGFNATNGYSTLAIGYEGEFGDELERHSLNASLRFRF
ncbi:MAG: autotransporter domain-containing protein [Hyphomonadaceae bacterium]